MKTYRTHLCFVLLGVLLCGCAPRKIVRAVTPIDSCPTIGWGCEYSPVALLDCANKFIAMGPDKAYAYLKTESTRGRKEYADGLEYAERDGKIVLLAAVLYRPESKEVVMPNFGQPSFEFAPLANSTNIVLPWDNILVFQDDIPFLTVSGFTLAGVAQSSLSFLDDCRQVGEFRTSPYRIPTRREAAEALKKLCERKSWRETAFFRDQVSRIPETKR